MLVDPTFSRRHAVLLLLCACLLCILVILVLLYDDFPHSYLPPRQEGLLSRLRRGAHMEPGVAHYLGCFQLETVFPSNTSLPYQLGAVECLLHCHHASCMFASVGIGREPACVCLADEMPGSVQKVKDSRCDLPCVSDPTFLCGGDDVHSLYWTGLEDTPAELDALENVTEVGCYSWTIGMTHAGTFAFSTEHLGPPLCVFVCNQSNFVYAGAFAGFICVCTNFLPWEEVKLVNESCREVPCSNESHVNSSCGGFSEVMLYRTDVGEEHASDGDPSLTLPSWLTPDLTHLAKEHETPMATEKLLFDGKERNFSSGRHQIITIIDSSQSGRLWAIVPVAVVVVLFIVVFVINQRRQEQEEKEERMLNTMRLYPVIQAYEDRRKEKAMAKAAEAAEKAGKGKKRSKKRTKSPGKGKKKAKGVSEGEESTEGDDKEAKKTKKSKKRKRRKAKGKQDAGETTSDKEATEEETGDKDKTKESKRKKKKKKKKKREKTAAPKAEGETEVSTEVQEVSEAPAEVIEEIVEEERKGSTGDVARTPSKEETIQVDDLREDDQIKPKKRRSFRVEEVRRSSTSKEEVEQADDKGETETPAEEKENEGKEGEEVKGDEEMAEEGTTEQKPEETTQEDNNSARRSRHSRQRHSHLEANKNAKRDRSKRRSSRKKSRTRSREYR